MHTGNFSDPRFDTNGVALAAPRATECRRSIAAPSRLMSCSSRCWCRSIPKARKASGFGRLHVTQSDRNTVDFYGDGGININGFWSARPDDSISLGFGYARISSPARGFDQDTLSFGTPTAVRSYEAVLEATYSAQIARGWTLQPDVQYVMFRRRRERSEFGKRATDSRCVCFRHAHDLAVGRAGFEFAAVDGARESARQKVTRPTVLAGRVLSIGARVDGGLRRPQLLNSD